MAEVAALSPPHTSFERDSVPGTAHRASLLALLGAHAMPVWGWGQRGAYAELVMDGPSLDHWVRTAGLWAEAERRLWEWEQMVAALTDEPADDMVRRAVGDLADRAVGAIEEWIDLVFLPVCLDGLGEQLLRTVASSTYGPLERHARRLVRSKRGQCAEGCSSLDEIVANAQVDRARLDERAERWLALARDFAERTTVLERETAWVDLGIAQALDPDTAMAGVEARLRTHLRGTR